MAQYITRRATNAAAVNTETQVNTDPDGNTPGFLEAIAPFLASLG